MLTVNIHTERIHDDVVWKKVLLLVSLFKKNNLSAKWYAINPTFDVYRQMNFDEQKWIERLTFLKNNGHEIQQHTHFYKDKKGDYDLSTENDL